MDFFALFLIVEGKHQLLELHGIEAGCYVLQQGQFNNLPANDWSHNSVIATCVRHLWEKGRKKALRVSVQIAQLIVSTTWTGLLPESCWLHLRYFEVVGTRHFVHFVLILDNFLKSNLELHTLSINHRKHFFFLRNGLYRNVLERILNSLQTLPWMPADWMDAGHTGKYTLFP